MKAIYFQLAAVILGVGMGSASATSVPGSQIIPVPRKMELRSGDFKLAPSARIVADAVSAQTAQLLASRLRTATGYPLDVISAGPAGAGNIFLTTKDADTNLGLEGYVLTVSTNLVVIRAPTQAGLFYGAQTLLQLLPPEIFSARTVRDVEWQAPCLQIDDRPRFKWRGLLLDVSRHFFTVQEVEQLLDAMAALKMNVFHWHLTDDQGWRIQIDKYPRLTRIGAWRPGVGFGLDPESTAAYGPDGRYGGFYTPQEIREVVKYAAARHITVVPEIEMPGHSLAALAAYPQFSCTGGPFSIPLKIGVFNGIYNPADPETFKFLDNVLENVFDLFPSQYVHLGGDEVPKTTWENSPACQLLMKHEGLTNEEQLQGWFMQRMENFVSAHGRVPVGWSEIMQGGLASHAVVMDWIGGGANAARAGHDVIMATHQYCYLCYYPSLDRPPNLRAYRPYLPLSKAYAFDPIPSGLESRYRSHILGVEACVWTPDIPSISDVEELTFPRLEALAEAAWSPESARNYNDFLERLNIEYRRLAFRGINFWNDDAVRIGEWKPAQITGQTNLLEWDVTQQITASGKYRLSLDFSSGENPLRIQWAALLENGKEMVKDGHTGFTGTASRAEMARDWNYFFDLPKYEHGARYAVRVSVVSDGGNDSHGAVFFGKDAGKINLQ